MLKHSGFAVTAAIFAQVLGAQRPAPAGIGDSSVDRIVALATDPGELGAVLRPIRPPRSRAKLDSIADRIATRAVAASIEEDKVRFDAIAALQHGGRRVAPGRHGIPYDGATERLVRIHRQSPALAPSRSVALFALTEVVGFDKGAAYLRDVAMSRDPTSGYAMRALAWGASPGAVRGISESDRMSAVDILRLIWDRVRPALDPDPGSPLQGEAFQKALDTVPNEEARAAIWAFAQQTGWARSREGRP